MSECETVYFLYGSVGNRQLRGSVKPLPNGVGGSAPPWPTIVGVFRAHSPTKIRRIFFKRSTEIDSIIVLSALYKQERTNYYHQPLFNCLYIFSKSNFGRCCGTTTVRFKIISVVKENMMEGTHRKKHVQQWYELGYRTFKEVGVANAFLYKLKRIVLWVNGEKKTSINACQQTQETDSPDKKVQLIVQVQILLCPP